ncbi:MAG: hypothetical protein IJC43_07725 [Clostridia bacterium]|nr:hypothetical protein [Clostridia bacterium]
MMNITVTKATTVYYNPTLTDSTATTRANIDLCITRLMMSHLTEYGFSKEEVKRMEDRIAADLGATIKFPR